LAAFQIWIRIDLALLDQDPYLEIRSESASRNAKMEDKKEKMSKDFNLRALTIQQKAFPLIC